MTVFGPALADDRIAGAAVRPAKRALHDEPGTRPAEWCGLMQVTSLRDAMPSILTDSPSPRRRVLLLICGLAVSCAGALHSGECAVAQEASEPASPVVGHWRNTKIVFEKPQDTHLVLHAEGIVET